MLRVYCLVSSLNIIHYLYQIKLYPDIENGKTTDFKSDETYTALKFNIITGICEHYSNTIS